MTNADSAIALKNVAKFYGKQRHVVLIEQLSLPQGGSVLLHGRNGSGKSTLLRILARVSTTDRGDVDHSARLLQGRLGYLPQSGGLYPELSLRDNLRLRRQLYGLRDIRPESVWYVRELGLIQFLPRRVSELSGGFQRLAAIAATLHIEPTWLLMDEPLSGVDAEMRGDLLGWFTELAREMDLFVVAAPLVEDSLGALTAIEMVDGRVA